MRTLHLIAAFGGLVLAGCATTAEQNDPSQGGFGNAISGVLGGQYDERIATRQAQQEAARSQNLRLSMRANELRAERDRLSLAVDNAQQRLSTSRDRLARLRQTLNQSQGNRSAERQRLIELEAQLNALQERANTVQASFQTIATSSAESELALIEGEMARLNSQFDLLAASID